MCQLSKFGHGLCSGQFSIQKKEQLFNSDGKPGEVQLYQEGIRPYMFRHLVGKGHKEFSTNKQQDTLEYITHFWEFLAKNEKNYQLSELSNLFEFQ
jgi:ubiquitin carboxyl-terminal hydrolase 5/13